MELHDPELSRTTIACDTKRGGEVVERREKWVLSSDAMNSLVQRNNFGGGSMPVFAIDVPDDTADKIHYAKIVVCGDKKLAQQLLDDHNQHAALVEQRDRLLRLLRPVTSPTACYCKVMKNEKCWHCEARELIAAVEQGEGRES